METVRDFIFLGSNSLQMVIAAMKLKEACSLEEELWPSSVQWLSCVQLFATSWTAACQASLSITNSRSLLKPMSIESVMPSNHFILCLPLLFYPQSFLASGPFPMSQFFSSGGQILEFQLWHQSFQWISQGWFPLGLTGLICLLSKGLWRVLSGITIQKNQFFPTQPSLWSNCHIHTWLLEKP